MKSASPSTETSQEEDSTLVFDASPSLEAQPPHDTVFVKPEDFSLFHAMFNAAKAQTRSYSWTHFTQAMIDAGCSVTQEVEARCTLDPRMASLPPIVPIPSSAGDLDRHGKAAEEEIRLDGEDFPGC